MIRLKLSFNILKELELTRVLKNRLRLRENALTDCIKAIVYLVKNEDRLKAFLDSPYGVKQNNNVEEKFRELYILRKGMIASDTCKGADNLTEFYSLYKTCILHNTDFEPI